MNRRRRIILNFGNPGNGKGNPRESTYVSIVPLMYIDFKYSEKIKNRIFSHLDPYGEEDWEN